MYYSSFGVLALILHLIINREILKKQDPDSSPISTLRYREFLVSVTAYYLTDILWGFFVDTRIVWLEYADTCLYFLSMSLSVILWVRYVVEYIDKKGTRSNYLLYAGYGIFAFVVINLCINFFNPVIFAFDHEGNYIPYNARYIIFVLLFLLNTILSVYSLFVSYKSEGNDKIHYVTVSASGFVMAVFIILQTLFPLLPYYAIGLLVSTCLIHVFVEEDEKIERDREFHDIMKKAEREHKKTEKARLEREIYNHIAESLAEDYEAIYYIDIETGKYREFSTSRLYESMKVPRYCEDFYSETRENARRYAHPDDREYAESLYYKDVMQNLLKNKRSYSYQYRIMVNGEPRFFRFVLMLAKDKKHFVLCDKDIQDEINYEKERREKQNTSITFGQIAESLASNYDVIYYVDANNGNFVGFTSHNIYGQLEVNRSGEDFYGESKANIMKIIHPEDHDRINDFITKDNLLTSLENRKELSIDYRLIVNDRSQHTRMSVRKSSDQEHFIVCVENIDAEVRKEKEHLKALNTEKELARRDELTGIKNKTAYSELEQSVQSNIDNGMDYLPFAIAVCDVNDLKKVNDSKGHKAGDEYIRSASKMLCDIFAHSPVFRIGGDEFVVFLRGDDYTARDDLILKLREQVMANMISGNGPVIASGMSEYDPGRDSTISQVFERADNEMYIDKRNIKMHG